MNEFVERLGWVLIHSLWQFVLVALLAGLVVRLLRRRTASLRYIVLVASLAASLGGPIATWHLLPKRSTPRHTLAEELPTGVAAADDPRADFPDVDEFPLESPSLALGNQTSIEPFEANAAVSPMLEAAPARSFATPSEPELGWMERGALLLRPWLGWIVTGWSCGVALCALRPLLGWHTLWRLKRVGVSPAAEAVAAAAERVSRQLGLRRVVRVWNSTWAQVPVVVGYLKPVILLPASLAMSIPLAQLEGILAHELAHVRRHDFVVNLLQTLIETLFFYHPAIWWLSRRIRVEREHCCDDLVVQALGNRAEYGRALVAVEELRGRASVLALGVADGSLLHRIRRIAGLGGVRPASRLSDLVIPTVIGLATIAMVLPLAFGTLAEQDILNSNETSDATDTTESTESDDEQNESATSGVQSVPPLLEFRIAAQPADSEPPEPVDPLERNVSLNGDQRTLQSALEQVAAQAGLTLELDLPALAQVELDPQQPVTASFERLALHRALGRLIDWEAHQGVMREVRGDRLVLTTLQAWQQRTLERLPEWMQLHYNHGLLARVDDQNAVVSVTTSSIVTGELLEKLASLPQLRELDIEVTKGLTPADLSHLGKMSRLEKLSLYSVNTEGAGLGDDAIRSVLRVASLRELSISECGTTDAGALLLEQMPQLRSLSLRQEGKLTDAALSSIGKLSQLESLSLDSYVGIERLGWMRFSANGIRRLKGLKDLQALHLVGQEVPADALEFPRLTALGLGHAKVGDDVAARIAGLRALRNLELMYCRIGDEGLRKIATLPELRRFNFNGLTVTDAGIAHFRSHPRLEHITLRAGGLTDQALEHVAQIKTLTRLDLYGSGQPGVSPGRAFSMEGLQQLRHLPQLETLYLKNLDLPGGYAGLKVLTHLRELSLMMCNITQGELDLLAEELPEARITHATGGWSYEPLKKRRGSRKRVDVSFPPQPADPAPAVTPDAQSAVAPSRASNGSGKKAASSAFASWPSFRHGPMQTGVASSPLPTKLAHRWEVKLGGPISGTAAIVKGQVYVASQAGELACLDRRTGERLWSYWSDKDSNPRSSPSFRTSPTVTDETVYLGDDEGVMHAIDRTTGVKRWTFKTDGEIRSAVQVTTGKVLFGSYDSHVYCLDEKDGALVWKFQTESNVHATPTIVDGLALVAGCDGHLRALDLQTGLQTADILLGQNLCTSPAVVDDKVYVGSYTGEVIAANWQTGGILWRYASGNQAFLSSPAVTNGQVCLGCQDKSLYVLDRANGELLWKFATGGKVDSAPVIAGSRLFVGADDGFLYEFDLESGALREKFPLGGPVTAAPAVGEGVLVIGCESESGRVVCLSGAPLDSQPATSEGWGPEHHGLRTRLMVNSTRHAVGQPLQVSFEVKNFGDVPRKFNPQGGSHFRGVEVIDPQGKPCEFVHPRVGTIANDEVLAPGKTRLLFENVDLAALFLLTVPGDYTIRMNGGPQGQVGPIHDELAPIPPPEDASVTLEPGELSPIQALFLKLRPVAPAGWGVTLMGEVIDFSGPGGAKLLPPGVEPTHVQVWFAKTEFSPAAEAARAREFPNEKLPPITRLGETPLGFGHITATAPALTAWPKCLNQLRSTIAGAARESRGARLRFLGGPQREPLVGLRVEITNDYGDQLKSFGTFTTDDTGMIQVTLPIAFYHLHLQADREFPYLPVEMLWNKRPRGPRPDLSLAIRESGAEKWLHGQNQSVDVKAPEKPGELPLLTYTLLPACELVLRAVDADTGRGLPGATFYQENAVGEDWAHPITGQNLGAALESGNRETPDAAQATDKEGRFIRLVGANAGFKYGVERPPAGYEEAESRGEVEIDIVYGQKRAEHVFKFRRKNASAQTKSAVSGVPMESPRPGPASQGVSENDDAPRGKLSGRFVFDGTPPVPIDLYSQLAALDPQPDSAGPPAGVERLYREFSQRGVRPRTTDESLIVGRDGGVSNIVVWVASRDIPWTPPTDKDGPTATIRFQDGRCRPRITTLAAGQSLAIENLDPVQANISLEFDRALNRGVNAVLPPAPNGNSLVVTPRVAEPWPAPLTNGMAPWTHGSVMVHRNAFLAVTGEDGSFEIPNLPAGEWEFRVWHEQCGYVSHWPQGLFRHTIRSGDNSLGTIRLSPQLFRSTAVAKRPAVPAQAREPIGEVLGQIVYRDQIANQSLQDLFAQPVRAKYQADHRSQLSPTEDELRFATEYYRQRQLERLEAEGGEAKIRELLAALEAQLAQGGLSEAEEQKLENEHRILRSKLDLDRSAGILTWWSLTNWKFQKHMYDNFGGGRVLVGKFGHEAFDATRRFLENAEQEGEFKITDAALRAKLYEPWTRDRGGFLKKDPEEIRTLLLEPEYVAPSRRRVVPPTSSDREQNRSDRSPPRQEFEDQKLPPTTARPEPTNSVAPPKNRVGILNVPESGFDSIQAAIDAAPEGAVIHIGEGRFDERLKITKPVTLVGAGSTKTVLGPTMDQQVRRRQALEEKYRFVESAGNTLPKDFDQEKFKKEVETLSREYSDPVIELKNVAPVTIRAMKITMPDTPRAGSGLLSASAVALNHAGLHVDDCAIVGCLGDGIRAENGSDLQMTNSLVAGVWGTGVAVFTRGQLGRLRIIDSDIRNCYHNNIWTGPDSKPCLIEGCRISGSAWFGIRFGDSAAVIRRNAIFDNARTGIYAESNEGTISHNLLYHNAMGGASCWFQCKATFERNLFVENSDAGLWVNGACEPSIHRNIFIGSPRAVTYGPIAMQKLNLEPTGKFYVRKNVFWKIDQPVVLRRPAEGDAEPRVESIALGESSGNRTGDPEISIDASQRLTLGATSPARDMGWDDAHLLTMKSRWPLTTEEQEMIPDDGTREWSKWKMRPRE
ncbi:MAG: PQQ-binding-like beta-propeller repeat protein [Planctomycetales bacterium]